MKKIISFISVASLMAMMLVLPSSALAANPLLCFNDAPGICSISSGVATLNNTGGGDSGVYTAVSSLSGKTLAQVGTDQLSFNYTGVPTAGSPRISLPIDTNADGTTDVYAFIGANLCNNSAGLVDAIHNSSCKIFITGGDVGGYTGWAAFVAAFPSAKVGPAANVPFVIADDVGSWTVSNIHLGSIVADNVVTNAATGITSTDATLNGTNGPTAATGHSFWVSLSSINTSSPTIPSGVYSTVDLGAIGANATFSAPLSSATGMPAVTPGTLYYFVAWSQVGGTWYPGAVLSFTTSTVTPPTPTNKDQCKDNGYKTFTNPSFKNQGQCVSHMNHDNKNDKNDKNDKADKTETENEND